MLRQGKDDQGDCAAGFAMLAAMLEQAASRTPFDTAQRVQQRAVETVRVAISVEVERHSLIERESDSLTQSVARERAVGHAVGWLTTDAWLARMRAERERLQHEARSVSKRGLQPFGRKLPKPMARCVSLTGPWIGTATRWRERKRLASKGGWTILRRLGWRAAGWPGDDRSNRPGGDDAHSARPCNLQYRANRTGQYVVACCARRWWVRQTAPLQIRG